MMSVLLGIDTGGTYTDAVLFNESHGVLASAKALTTKQDLSIGIRNAIDGVLRQHRAEISLVSISTTLATNALVEGQGSSIALLLIGYPPDTLEQAGLRQALGNDPIVFVAGGHDVYGDEQQPLDLAAARQAIMACAPRAAAFAISGYFSVRNPAHELAVRDLVHALTGLPVTCGHELTRNLNAPRRALTAALNARLIPLVQQLILAVRAILAERRIGAPLMVVKGDGSLMSAEMALQRPVETILSGPAASVVGARYLSGQADVFVIDMGGTTSDIALLRNGRPVLNSAGAVVGGWQTMVEAVAVHTFGLGGDSEVRLEESGDLLIGPRRITPLSLLAHHHPHVIEILRTQAHQPTSDSPDHLRYNAQFVFPVRAPAASREKLGAEESTIWRALERGIMPLTELLNNPRTAYFQRRALMHLVERGLAGLSGFTPTDSAHVLGLQSDWSVEAARLGAEIWARRAELTRRRVTDGSDFSRQVLRQVVLQAGRALVSVALAEMKVIPETTNPLSDRPALRRVLIDSALEPSAENDLACNTSIENNETLLQVSLTLQRPLVAIGAPAPTYLPSVAKQLSTRVCIPEHAGVANAVGAVVGGIVQTARAIVRPLERAGYRAHLPNGMHTLPTLEEAVALAEHITAELAEAQAKQAGAVHVTVETRRHDHIARVKRDEDLYEDTFLESEIVSTAIGRPRLAGE
ncbi:MAG: hydantoinase/oxoprolinase family protein [Anaerolineae bacterium]|nr:hydantoinase/oxoprolinase family protein [Thermoflexales bacterium]MDW8406414.1 hydantoinase/oxoprolinase family protein [Anaerolineae bacterium]